MNIELSLKRRKTTVEQFTDAVAVSRGTAEVLRALNLHPSGSNYRWFHVMIDLLKLDISHHVGMGHLSGKRHNWSVERPIDEVFVKNSTFVGGSSLKRKVLKYNLIPHRCEQCPITNEWQGKPISLQLDHRDGDPRNNTIENLRFLCPNCHSQTHTFAGRNNAGGKIKNAAVLKR